MSTFVHYLPNFFDFDRPPPVEFTSIMDVDVVRQATQMQGFSYLALHKEAVIAVYEDGFVWLVLGFVRGELPDLPTWNGGRYKAEYPDGRQVVIPGDRVKSIVHDRMTLDDDTIVTRLPWNTPL